jgi:hypothetical protein
MAVPSDIPSDFRKHAKEAAEQGWRLRKVESGYQLFAPDGKNTVTIPKTPSARSTRNYLADMRKFGYKDR